MYVFVILCWVSEDAGSEDAVRAQNLNMWAKSIGLGVLGLFLVLMEPLRGYLYWAFESSAFGSAIGGTGGVGGYMGLTVCQDSSYCFWYDTPGLGLTWLSVFLALVWWAPFLLLSPSKFYSTFNSDFWAKLLSGLSVWWFVTYLGYYFVLTTFYRQEPVLGISLAAACGLLMKLTLLSLSLAKLGGAASLLDPTSLCWTSSSSLHKSAGIWTLIFSLLHGMGELTYLTKQGTLFSSVSLAYSETQGDPIYLTGALCTVLAVIQAATLTAYMDRTSSVWFRRLKLMLIFSSSSVSFLVLLAVISHQNVLFLCLLLMICVLVSTMSFLLLRARQSSMIYEDVWRKLHPLIGYVLICICCFHFTPSLLFFLPGISFHVSDLVLRRRLTRWSQKNIQSSVAGLFSDMVKIRLRIPKDCVFSKGASVALLSLVDDKMNQIHPFSLVPISSSEADVYVKVSGDWTLRIHQLALEENLWSKLRVVAPIPVPLPNLTAKHLIAVCGGIGITGVTSFLDEVISSKLVDSVSLICVVPSEELLTPLIESRLLDRWHSSWTINVFFTRNSKNIEERKRISQLLVERLKPILEPYKLDVKLKYDTAVAKSSLVGGVLGFLLIWSWRAACIASKSHPTIPSTQSALCLHSWWNGASSSSFFNVFALIGVVLGAFLAAIAHFSLNAIWMKDDSKSARAEDSILVSEDSLEGYSTFSLKPQIEFQDHKPHLASEIRKYITADSAIVTCLPPRLQKDVEEELRTSGARIFSLNFRT